MIAILLSTYNGEKYLEQQLNSIISQTFKDFKLYVRDDGSTDRTLEILNSYASKYPNIIICKDDKNNVGASKSFMSLLGKVEADYYMFCDQDDVWFESKIQTSLSIIKSEEARSFNIPLLIHTDLIVVDENLNILKSSLWNNNKLYPNKYNSEYLKVVNVVTGCTCLFNRLARDIAIRIKCEIIMHDFWLSICVDSAGGKIISLPFPSIYYRQHQNNVIGASKNNHLFYKFNRYFHLPDFDYSVKHFRMLKGCYKINFMTYLILRTKFYLKY